MAKKAKTVFTDISSNPDHQIMIEHTIPENFSFPNDLEKIEAEWITQIRDYCKETKTFPPHILQFYKENHTEKAPD